MGGYTRPVPGQQLGKHVPAATDAHVTEETECFFVVHAEVLQGRDKVSCQFTCETVANRGLCERVKLKNLQC
jgi:hypothetical protein